MIVLSRAKTTRRIAAVFLVYLLVHVLQDKQAGPLVGRKGKTLPSASTA